MIHCVIPDDFQFATRELSFLNKTPGFTTSILGDLYRQDGADKILASADALILIRERTIVDDRFLYMTQNLKVISQTGKIARNIDLEACKRRGIAVVEGFGDPVAPAELAWLMMMSARRKFWQSVSGMKNGQWQTNIGETMASQTLGILGFGNTGKIIYKYASAFNMKIQVWGSQRAQDEAKRIGIHVPENRQEFFATSDIVTVHQRLVPETIGNISVQDLTAMGPNSLFCNTSRAELIESGALIEALNIGRPGYAALDVYDEEPIYDINHTLLKLDNVLCSPHMGYVEKNSYQLYIKTAFENVINFFGS